MLAAGALEESLEGLSSLDVSYVSYYAGAAPAGLTVRIGPAGPSLRHLDLSHLAKSEPHRQKISAKAIVGALSQCPSLATLNLAGNGLHDSGLELIVEALAAGAAPALEELDLSRNCLRNGNLLAKLLANCFLRLAALSLEANELSDLAIVAICAGLSMGVSVRQLNLAQNRFGDDGVAALAQALRRQCSMQVAEAPAVSKLALARWMLGLQCGLEQGGMPPLVSAVPGLQLLDLSSNEITDVGAAMLAEVARDVLESSTSSIGKLRLCSCSVGSRGRAALEQAVHASHDRVEEFVRVAGLALRLQGPMPACCPPKPLHVQGLGLEALDADFAARVARWSASLDAAVLALSCAPAVCTSALRDACADNASVVAAVADQSAPKGLACPGKDVAHEHHDRRHLETNIETRTEADSEAALDEPESEAPAMVMAQQVSELTEEVAELRARCIVQQQSRRLEEGSFFTSPASSPEPEQEAEVESVESVVAGVEHLGQSLSSRVLGHAPPCLHTGFANVQNAICSASGARPALHSGLGAEAVDAGATRGPGPATSTPLMEAGAPASEPEVEVMELPCCSVPEVGSAVTAVDVPTVPADVDVAQALARVPSALGSNVPSSAPSKAVLSHASATSPEQRAPQPLPKAKGNGKAPSPPPRFAGKAKGKVGSPPLPAKPQSSEESKAAPLAPEAGTSAPAPKLAGKGKGKGKGGPPPPPKAAGGNAAAVSGRPEPGAALAHPKGKGKGKGGPPPPRPGLAPQAKAAPEAALAKASRRPQRAATECLGGSAPFRRKLYWKPLELANAAGTIFDDGSADGEHSRIDVSALQRMFEGESAKLAAAAERSSSLLKSVQCRVEGTKILSDNRARNVAIVLRRLPISTCALTRILRGLEWEDAQLRTDQLEQVLEAIPTKEESEQLRPHCGSEERTRLRDIEQLVVPLAELRRGAARVRLICCARGALAQLEAAAGPLGTLRAACNAIHGSEMLREVMLSALEIGNYINHGDSSKGAKAITVGSLLQLRDFRMGKMSSLHFLCAQLHRADAQRDVSEVLNRELSPVLEASKFQIQGISQAVRAFDSDLQMVAAECRSFAHEYADAGGAEAVEAHEGPEEDTLEDAVLIRGTARRRLALLAAVVERLNRKLHADVERTAAQVRGTLRFCGVKAPESRELPADIEPFLAQLAEFLRVFQQHMSEVRRDISRYSAFFTGLQR